MANLWRAANTPSTAGTAEVAVVPRRMMGTRRLYRWRVPCGYAVGVIAFLLAEPTFLSLALGLLLAVPGAVIRAWASGHIEKTKRLATGGPYGHTQHPLYLGSSVLALGVAVASASLWTVLAAGAYLVAFYPFTMRDEQEFLLEKFGHEYASWTAEVPHFFPLLRAAGPQATHFRWDRVFRNREWKTWLVLPTVLVLLHLWSKMSR